VPSPRIKKILVIGAPPHINEFLALPNIFPNRNGDRAPADICLSLWPEQPRILSPGQFFYLTKFLQNGPIPNKAVDINNQIVRRGIATIFPNERKTPFRWDGPRPRSLRSFDAVVNHKRPLHLQQGFPRRIVCAFERQPLESSNSSTDKGREKQCGRPILQRSSQFNNFALRRIVAGGFCLVIGYVVCRIGLNCSSTLATLSLYTISGG
jgi:hypothetical protein